MRLKPGDRLHVMASSLLAVPPGEYHLIKEPPAPTMGELFSAFGDPYKSGRDQEAAELRAEAKQQRQAFLDRKFKRSRFR